MGKILALIAAEPVRLVAAIQSTLAVAVLFGLDLNPGQLAGLVMALSAWLAFGTRSAVTPV